MEKRKVLNGTLTRFTPKRIVWSFCGPVYLEGIKKYKKNLKKKAKRGK